jgi:hypothetical protein
MSDERVAARWACHWVYRVQDAPAQVVPEPSWFDLWQVDRTVLDVG